MLLCHSDSIHQKTKQPRLRHGLTLIEILIALTMTLIVLGSMMAAFNYASIEMKNGRAIMELANRARGVEDQFRADVARLTVDPRPHTGSVRPNGYLEIIERPRTDATDAFTAGTSYMGDVDDVIGMTIRAENGNLFRGRSGGAIVESPLAEVVWFTSVQPAGAGNAANFAVGAGGIAFDATVRVHRRQLLIRPDLGVLATGQTPDQVNAFLAANDISCRVFQDSATPTFTVTANDLTDLALRQNRFAHDIGAFPHNMLAALLSARQHSAGEDIMLTDVCAFDLRVYSPDASVVVDATANIAIEPSDGGFATASGTLPSASLGAFVDMGSIGTGWFFGAPSAKSQLTVGVFDTWTPFYESDGIDQDGTLGADQGTNGINDVVTGGTAAPDDEAERETEPPYPNPLRGLELRLRLIEKGTKKVFQTSVVQSFVPE